MAIGRTRSDADFDDDIEDPIDAREIFDLIRNINDPGNYCLIQLFLYIEYGKNIILKELGNSLFFVVE